MRREANFRASIRMKSPKGVSESGRLRMVSGPTNKSDRVTNATEMVRWPGEQSDEGEEILRRLD
ncbi:hypothetical protein AUJ67_06015 [Candidatus Desantisbacteria bacterium CG1_02_49_89]|nr:MAG: hypothetical protein AUJ67_06015 [Candidatus Desantisbacteria bacterium CG1_02_49_89]